MTMIIMTIAIAVAKIMAEMTERMIVMILTSMLLFWFPAANPVLVYKARGDGQGKKEAGGGAERAQVQSIAGSRRKGRASIDTRDVRM